MQNWDFISISNNKSRLRKQLKKEIGHSIYKIEQKNMVQHIKHCIILMGKVFSTLARDII